MVCRAYERYGVAGAQSPPSCMQDAYNYLLAAYRHYGPDSQQTRDAVAEAARVDPAARVPQLLAGLHYPCITRSPGVVQGSAAEALVGPHALQHGCINICQPSTSRHLNTLAHDTLLSTSRCRRSACSLQYALNPALGCSFTQARRSAQRLGFSHKARPPTLSPCLI
jgi:hypothetical protein